MAALFAAVLAALARLIPVMAASLPVPASMMPLSVPVRNVAMGMISSKNLASMGLMAFKGCVTKIMEYSTTNTMPIKVRARQMPMKNLRRIMSSSSVKRLRGGESFRIFSPSLCQKFIYILLWVPVLTQVQPGVT